MKLIAKFSLVFVLSFISYSTTYSSGLTLADPPATVTFLDKDFPLFKDSDYKILYVDFELLTVNIKTLRIVKEDGKVVFSDDVSDRSVNAIYEIDYSSYPKGIYRLELFTYLGEALHSDFAIE